MSERLKNKNDFDVLADILDTLRFNGSIFFDSKLAAPWGISLAPRRTPRFHILFSGTCYAGNDESQPVKLGACEIVMFAGSSSHWIADEPGRTMVTSEAAGNACELGSPFFNEGTITNRILCGTVNFDQNLPHPILNSLPDMLHFKELDKNGQIWSIVALIEAEIRRKNSHTGRVIDRMTEVLFLQLLDNYAEENPGESGFLGVLKDRRIYQALALIHEAPEFPWTLEILGEKVGMSRATLVRHFNESIGSSPMIYVTDWRLTKAFNLCKYSDMPIEKIAGKVGFSSANALNKAFLRKYELTPHSLRISA